MLYVLKISQHVLRLHLPINPVSEFYRMTVEANEHYVILGLNYLLVRFDIIYTCITV